MKSSDWMLWTGVMLAPLAWLASLEASFALAPLVCMGHGRGLLMAVSAAALVLTLGGGWIAWSQRVSVRKETGGPPRLRERRMAMAVAGVGLSALFAAVIVAQAVPNFVLGCE